MTLYDINGEIEATIMEMMASVDEETGEVSDEAMEKLSELQMARDEKLDNIGAYIKNLDAEAKALKEEEQALASRRKVKENEIERLKAYVASNLNGQKFESARVCFSFRKSKAVVIDEAYIENIPSEYLIAQEPKIDRKALKADIEAGKDLDGIAHIEEKQNLQIK